MIPAGTLLLRRREIRATCTPSRRFILRAVDAGPEAFIAAVKTDSPGKHELDPKPMVSKRLSVSPADSPA